MIKCFPVKLYKVIHWTDKANYKKSQLIREKKKAKFSLILLYFLFSCVIPVFDFSTHNTTISRTFERDEAVLGESITVTVSFTNNEAYDLRGFYYSEQIPEGLSVETQSVKINGSDILNHIAESDSTGNVYSGYIPYRWILEFPSLFEENNRLSTGANLVIIYTISASQGGIFNFDEFNWVGYYETAPEGERAAFGHSDDADKKTISFIATGPCISVSPTSLSNSAAEGSSPPDQTFNVWNSGVGTLNYSISVDENWLSCNPASGTSTGEQDAITLSYSTSSLSSGEYTAAITVSDAGASNSPQTIPVSLIVLTVSQKDEMEGGSPCFIATAAFGSSMDYHVKVLCGFRDKRLQSSRIGRGLVNIYYKLSPPVAKHLRRHRTARVAVRYALIPITAAAYLALYVHPLILLFGFFCLLLGSILCYRRFQRSRA